MRAKEIINEGPIWQGVKSKLGGGTYTGGYNVAKGQAQIAKIAKDAEPSWFQAQASYQQRNVDPKQMGNYLTQWARKWFEVPTLPAYSTAVKLPQVTDQGVRKYLQIAASHYMAPQLDDATPPLPPANNTTAPAADTSGTDTDTTNSAGAGAMSAMAGQLGSRAPTSTATSTGGVTTQTSTGQTHTASANNPNRPTATTTPPGSSNTIFQDPVAFKAEFDKYIKGLGVAQINNDELKSVLKTMWMQTGGTRVESKKHKGQRI